MNTAILNIPRSEAVWSNERSMTVIDPRLMEAIKTKVAAYARTSSDSADQQNSYISQVRYYTQIIRENDEWEYVDIYADEGLTGLSADKRPDFQRLMDDCRKRKINRILCKSVSRFARNFYECVMTIRELKMLGVSVLFEKENIDTANMGDELEITIQGLWAQRESISLSENLRRGNRMRMKNGTFLPSSIPYGYTLENRELKIDEEQANVVRRIYAAYLSGRGMQDIADEFNQKGAPKRFGHDRWHTSTVFYILTNISYTGDMIWQKKYTTDSLPFKQVINKGEKPRYYVQNDHPAIVSHEDFEKVRNLMAKRRERHRGAEPGDHILGKKVVCGLCGSIHRRKVTGGKVYWACRKHDYSKSLCEAPQVPEPELFAAFARMWNKLRGHRTEIIGPMLEQFRALADRQYKQNDRIAQVNNELEALSEQILVLKRLNTKGYMESASFYAQTQEINAQVRELRALKSSLIKQHQTGGSVASLEALDAALETGPEWLDGMDEDLFDEIVDKVTVLSPEQVKIKLACGLELTENIQRMVR